MMHEFNRRSAESILMPYRALRYMQSHGKMIFGPRCINLVDRTSKYRVM